MKNNVAMIPARIGSERLKEKNLALIDGKPLIYYAIRAAKDSGVFNKIIVNGDNELFGKIAIISLIYLCFPSAKFIVLNEFVDSSADVFRIGI